MSNILDFEEIEELEGDEEVYTVKENKDKRFTIATLRKHVIEQVDSIKINDPEW